ncbi:hypothetical protein FB451DRAFT_1185566 [Mycena latifolia]|nr:hypothetical protein FB451DRAFT_1185566 [Mycena latifolia]
MSRIAHLKVLILIRETQETFRVHQFWAPEESFFLKPVKVNYIIEVECSLHLRSRGSERVNEMGTANKIPWENKHGLAVLENAAILPDRPRATSSSFPEGSRTEKRSEEPPEGKRVVIHVDVDTIKSVVDLKVWVAAEKIKLFPTLPTKFPVDSSGNGISGKRLQIQQNYADPLEIQCFADLRNYAGIEMFSTDQPGGFLLVQLSVKIQWTFGWQCISVSSASNFHNNSNLEHLLVVVLHARIGKGIPKEAAQVAVGCLARGRINPASTLHSRVSINKFSWEPKRQWLRVGHMGGIRVGGVFSVFLLHWDGRSGLRSVTAPLLPSSHHLIDSQVFHVLRSVDLVFRGQVINHTVPSGLAVSSVVS